MNVGERRHMSLPLPSGSRIAYDGVELGRRYTAEHLRNADIDTGGQVVAGSNPVNSTDVRGGFCAGGLIPRRGVYSFITPIVALVGTGHRPSRPPSVSIAERAGS
jgi:hypothetical protein